MSKRIREHALRPGPAAWLSSLISAGLLLACGTEPSTENAAKAPTDAVAAWNGGSLSLAELEEQLPQRPTRACRAWRRAEGGGAEKLLPCYRELAEELVVERLVLAEVEDLDGAIARMVADEERRRPAFLQALHQRLAAEMEVTGQEVEAYYAAHREDFHRSAQISLWNIFLRHQDPANPEATLARLRELKARVEAGENFATVARESSQSETRLRDGFVGRIPKGHLPSQLEEIAFALESGEVSEPFLVKEGAVLLHVRDVVEEGGLPLEDARDRIRLRLVASKVDTAIETRLAALDVPGLEELNEPERRRKEREALHRAIEASTEPGDRELREAVEEHLREQAVAEIVDERLREAMAQLLDASPEDLQRYLEVSQTIFQDPPRFRLHLWDLPFAEDPPGQLARMEALQKKLGTGETTLAAAVEELGGNVRELGWQTLEDLRREHHPKVRGFLLLLPEGESFTVPFQYDDALHLLWVAEREEPPLPEYAAVEQELRQRYLERFGQKLYGAVAEERLAAVDFRFHEDTVRRLLLH